ncbi:unnamed protein product [Rotaria magnacalcarata]|uniref:Major facilitator superfamily (MFS) profile domain-containing protein n=1 Tax=Rotaria magnacalcarata TaxID=392030 RepID=A0A8S2P4X6_9BILA|nr:unnamed protein product [Rotaria magnacalcarata]
MALAPLFGYLGDRYSRKMLITVGVSVWSVTTLAGSFVPKNLFAVFAILRGLVGIGEASYSCVAPTIIADMYKHDMRTRMLALFNIAVPVGGGLGYIVGAYVSVAFNGNWRWALRITPVLGIVCVILLAVLVREPVRGGADGAQVLKRDNWYRKRNQRGDPIVCGVAVLVSVPFLFVALIYSKDNIILTWISIFIAETLLCSNWAIISDMLMYIIVPARRATASSMQIFILHLFGDASSPYIIGLISDFFSKGVHHDDVLWKSLRYAFMLTPVVAGFGGIAFLFAAIFIVRDRHEAEATIESANTLETFHMEVSSNT